MLLSEEINFSSKEVYAIVYSGNSELFKTRHISGRSNDFNEGRDFTWNVDSPSLEFRIVNVGWIWDDDSWHWGPYVFSGFDEYKFSSRCKVSDTNYYFTVAFEPNATIPEPPSTW